jgi:hypothetical protein
MEENDFSKREIVDDLYFGSAHQAFIITITISITITVYPRPISITITITITVYQRKSC